MCVQENQNAEDFVDRELRADESCQIERLYNRAVKGFKVKLSDDAVLDKVRTADLWPRYHFWVLY